MADGAQLEEGEEMLQGEGDSLLGGEGEEAQRPQMAAGNHEGYRKKRLEVKTDLAQSAGSRGNAGAAHRHPHEITGGSEELQRIERGDEGWGCDPSDQDLTGEGGALTPSSRDRYARMVKLALNLSLVLNVLLMLSKVFAYWKSNSKSVLATLADSFVDLLSQLVIAIAEWSMARYDPRYPVGKTRLETIGVIISAAIMSAASIEVMQSSVMELLSSEHEISLDIYTYVILGSTIVLKIFLFFYCYQLREVSGSALAVAEDHFNDIISNSGAIMTAALASERADLWWMDPVGGGLIAVYIVFRWIILAKNHIDKLVGICADPEFIEHVKQVADTHHSLLQTDAIRVYYFGQRHIVELEVILPATMTVRESHDIALELQHRIEALDEVERCFVHVDYQSRQDELPEHKTERELILGAGQNSDVSEVSK